MLIFLKIKIKKLKYFALKMFFFLKEKKKIYIVMLLFI